MDTISAEFVLGNYFENSDKPLTYGKLRNLRSDIEHAVGGVVCVDISPSSLDSAIELYPDLFRWYMKTITRCDTFYGGKSFCSHYDPHNRVMFGDGIREDIKLKAYEAIVQFCKIQDYGPYYVARDGKSL